MATIINADNGLASGSAGLKQSADGSGNLVLQSSGNTVISIDTGLNTNFAGSASAVGNVTGGNVLTAGLMSSTGNAVHGNILTAGLLSVTGNITSAGNVALGLTTANARLHVSGNIYATADIISSYSDERLKTRLGNIDNPVEKVCAIETFYYEPNSTALTLGAEPGRQVGVSAQSVQQVQTETVTTSPLSPDYLTVKYERLVPLLIAAVQEQQRAIEELKSEINTLKKG
jgi:hypothetical protein